MSTRSDTDLPERDSRVDAAWRSASNELPPPALDEAILAAAHRAVGARPGRVDAPVPEATRPERWWFPLAAAATIGAITVGLLQLAATDPPDGIDPTKMIVSDVPPVAATDTRNDAAAAPKAASAPAAPVTPAPPPGTPERAPAAVAVPPPALAGAPSPAPAGAARAQAKVARSGQGAPAATDAAEATGSTAGGGGIAESAPPAPAATGPRDAAAPRPFPRERSASMPVPAAAPAPVASSSPAAAAVAPPPVPRAAMAMNAPDAATLPEVAKRAAPSAERAAPDAARERREAREPLPVAEWIALIRKLRNEGRDAEAEQELVAFRKRHPDHEQLLPPDLSRWTPAAK